MASRLTAWFESAIAFLLFLIVIAVVVLVVMRYAFGTGLVGLNEWLRIMFVYTSTIGASIALARREHIAIEYFADRLPQSWQRGLEASRLLLLALLNGVLFVYSLDWIGATGSYLMPATQAPQVWAQASVPIGSALAVAYCLLRLAPTEPREAS